VRTNVIPKQGGNRFTSYFFANDMNASMQWDNLDDDLKQQNATAPHTWNDANANFFPDCDLANL
jgi:hypothetical protein